MPKVKTQLPTFLEPYAFHGVDIQYRPGNKQAFASECPLCGKENNKFTIEVETGLFHCYICQEGTSKGGGNVRTFYEKLWLLSYEGTTVEDYEALAQDRGLLSGETPRAWGAALSLLTREWILPAYSAEGRLESLYRYSEKGGSRVLLAPPKIDEKGHRMFGVHLFDPTKADVFVTEGPWDGMALWELFRSLKDGENGWAVTGNPEGSLLAGINVVAVPGASSFPEAWLPLFEKKRVALLFDNDYPRTDDRSGKVFPPAGWAGMKRAANALTLHKTPPESIHVLKWGEEGYDGSLPKGTDVRDVLKGGEDASERAPLLVELLDRVVPMPTDWTGPKNLEGGTNGRPELVCLPCDSWGKLVNEWRKAMTWTEGLDRALSVMMACSLSTKLKGDQLWVMIVGPPSCLHKDTLIHDPIDGTEKTVEKRWKDRVPFHVYSLGEGGEPEIRTALPPERLEKTDIYEVTFRSGRKMKVTLGHRFWDGVTYVPLDKIQKELLVSASYRLPTISEPDLSVRVSNARRSRRTTLGSLEHCCVYSCLYGEPLLRGKDIFQETLPLQDGVLAHTPRKFGKDGRVVGDKYTPRHNGRLSSFRGLIHGESPSGPQPRSIEGTSEPYLRSFSFDGRLPQRSYLESRDLTRTESSRRPKEVFEALPCCLEGPSSLPQSLPRRVLTLEGTRSPERTVLQFVLGEPLGASASPLASTLPWLPADSVGVNTGPSSVAYKSLRRSDLLDKDVQPVPLSRPYSISSGLKTTNRRIVPESDEIVKVEKVGYDHYFDFHVPITNNYWAEGYFHHNCGKSVLCEAMSVNKRYVLAKSTIRGFHSGFGRDDFSLIQLANEKTLVTKDGDTLLQSPNRDQILSEARDVYDRASRTHYRTGVDRDYEHLSITWILCGTSSLRELDTSELGERFVCCVIVEDMEEELERDIGWRIALRAVSEMNTTANGTVEGVDSIVMTKAKQLTGGYINHLRQNAEELVNQVEFPEENLRRIQDYAEFVSFIRSRPSKKQQERVERELSFRLISQLARLAKCLAVVLNRPSVDDEVLRRVRRCARNSCRGRTFEMVKVLHRNFEIGLEAEGLSKVCHETPESGRALLNFLAKIQVVEKFHYKLQHIKTTLRWKLTDRLRRLFDEVMLGDE